MSDWPAALFAAAERIAREQAGSGVLDVLGAAAARLGLRDEAARLARELEPQSGVALANVARIHAALGDRAAVDRLRARVTLDSSSDPVGVQSWTFAAAYQQLGDDAGADRIVENIGDPETRWAARAVLVHAAVETGRQDRAASLTRALAAAPIPDGSALAAVRTLAAGSTDRTTAAVTAPMAEQAAATVGLDSRDEAMTIAAQLWLRADKPEEALRIAHPIAKRVRRDFNSAWYADLATVLSDAGDAKAGTSLFDRHVEWYEQERTVADDARAVLALAHHGRGADAEDVMENLAEPRLKDSGGASLSDSARRVVVDAYLALDDVASAIRTTVGFSSRRERIDALLTIAFYGHDHDTPSTPEIAEALEQIG